MSFVSSGPCQHSVANSTYTALDAGETFTGSPELSYHPDLMITGKTDQDGVIYTDFSFDGVNYDSTLTFYVYAGIPFFHTLVKGSRAVRVRFNNSSASNQTYLRMHVEYGTFRQGTSPLSLNVSQDADAAVVRSISSNIEIARGAYTGYIAGQKFGRNTDVDAAEDVWRGGGDYTGFPVNPTAETVDLFSSSDEDGAGTSTGLLTCRIYGLDANWELQEEDITLTGTTPATSSNTWVRVNRLKGLTAGSVGSNVGNITIRHTTTTANVFAQVTAGRNQTEIACTTVPAGYNGFIPRIRTAGARATGSGLYDASFQVREFGGVWRPVQLFTAGNNVQADVRFEYPLGPIPEKSDVKIRVESVSAANLDIDAEFDTLWIKDVTA